MRGRWEGGESEAGTDIPVKVLFEIAAVGPVVSTCPCRVMSLCGNT